LRVTLLIKQLWHSIAGLLCVMLLVEQLLRHPRMHRMHIRSAPSLIMCLPVALARPSVSCLKLR
jgi:hypothetical protein